jgi:putative ATP-binding cassette transporter
MIKPLLNESIPRKHISFINIILQNSNAPIKTILFYTVLSGIANAGLLSVINSAANSATYGSVNLRYVAIFAIEIAIFYITKRYILRKSVEIVEVSIYNIRLRLLEKLRNCELFAMELIGKSEIFTRISNDANFISQSAAVIVNATQAVVLVFFTLLYIAYLSFKAFLITIAVISFGTTFYLRRQKEINQELREVNLNETAIYDQVENLINGFKEIKINSRKNDNLFDDIKDTSTIGKDTKIKTGLRFVVGFMFSEMVFYLLLASVVFLLPQFNNMFPSTLTRLTAAILFIIGPLENIVSTIPLFIKANIATDNIQKLESRIDAAKDMNTQQILSSDLQEFEKIELKDLLFKYVDDEQLSTFALGPINYTFKKGEILCIVGGNGSGKSTFLKLLTSLYQQESGTLSLNDVSITAQNYLQYRSLFSIVFTDFHLFPKIYGVEKLSAEKVNKYIELMGLKGKTFFDGEKFTNVKLSTGQRKRLAFICCLLEDKPIMVLDEVTADQDPEFKKFFYLTILPDLKKQGKTVIMVSHDDKYFEQFDRIVKMEYGKLVDYSIT